MMVIMVDYVDHSNEYYKGKYHADIKRNIRFRAYTLMI